jgi:hypothetical protein
MVSIPISFHLPLHCPFLTAFHGLPAEKHQGCKIWPKSTRNWLKIMLQERSKMALNETFF